MDNINCFTPSRMNTLSDIRLKPNFSSILKILKRFAGKSINDDRTITDIITSDPEIRLLKSRVEI